jgi:archaellum biogenesis ATPase FlaH
MDKQPKPSLGLVEDLNNHMDQLLEQAASQNNGHAVAKQESQSVRLSTIVPKGIEWLHKGRIPRGKITILAGDPDVGKTFLTLDIAARVSTGNRWPDGAENKAGNVLILSAEDDLADTLVPRLQAAGADLDRIQALPTITKINSDTNEVVNVIPSLTKDLQTIEKEIALHKTKLLIIDPINAYLPGVDTHRDAELRAKVFAPLKLLAEEYGLALICVMHLNKSSSMSAKHRVSGSIAYVAASRATWLITNDKDQHSRKLMIPVKFNIGPKPDGMAYKIIENQEKQPILDWESDPITITANEALELDQGSAPARKEAKEFLQQILQEGTIPRKEIKSHANDMDISNGTLRRAKDALNIKAVAIRKKGKRGVDYWVWQLPKDV